MKEVDEALKVLSAASVDREVVTWVDTILPSLSSAEQEVEDVAHAWYVSTPGGERDQNPRHSVRPAASTEVTGGSVEREGGDDVDEAGDEMEEGVTGAGSGNAEVEHRIEGEMEEGEGGGNQGETGPTTTGGGRLPTASVLPHQVGMYRAPETAHEWRSLTLATLRGQGDYVANRVVRIFARWRDEGRMNGDGDVLQLPCACCGSDESSSSQDGRKVNVLSFAHCGISMMSRSTCARCGAQQQGTEGHPLLVPAAEGLYFGLDLVAFVQATLITLHHNLSGAASALRTAMAAKLFESGVQDQEGRRTLISDSAVRTARRRVLRRASCMGQVNPPGGSGEEVDTGCRRCEQRGGPRAVTFDGAAYFRTRLPRLIPYADEV